MKMKKTGSFVAVAAALALFSCTEKKADSVRLFNGTDLTGWVLYMQDSTLNPQQEFVVRDSVIALSGPFGYVRTDKAYSNYKLNAQWRWPDSATNSGIFVNIQQDGIWPDCYECQLWNGRAGDLINSGCDDSTVTVYINGELQNRITGVSNNKGYIGLQSEGGPIEFRRVELTPLE